MTEQIINKRLSLNRPKLDGKTTNQALNRGIINIKCS